MPKSDVRVVLLAVIALISWLLHVMQSQRYERVVKRLSEATLNNLGPKNGGSKETMDLYKRAADLYDEHIKECKHHRPVLVLSVNDYVSMLTIVH